MKLSKEEKLLMIKVHAAAECSKEGEHFKDVINDKEIGDALELLTKLVDG